MLDQTKAYPMSAQCGREDVLLLGRGEPLPDASALSPVDALDAGYSRTAATKVAVCGGDREARYAEVDAWAQRISARLSGAGCGRGDRVGMLFDPSAAILSMVLG